MTLTILLTPSPDSTSSGGGTSASSFDSFVRYSNEQWDAHKGFLKELYMEEKKPLPRVMTIMKETYGFNASIKAYKRRFDAWGWKKNLTRERVFAEIRRQNALQHQIIPDEEDVKDSQDSGDQILNAANIERYRKRNKITTGALTTKRPTPSPKSTTTIPARLTSPDIFQTTERILLSTDQYVKQCFASGLWVYANNGMFLSSPDQYQDAVIVRGLTNSIVSACRAYHDGDHQTALYCFRAILAGMASLIDSTHHLMLPEVLRCLRLMAGGGLTDAARAFAGQIAKVMRMRNTSLTMQQIILSFLGQFDMALVADLELSVYELYLELFKQHCGPRHNETITMMIDTETRKIRHRHVGPYNLLRMVNTFDNDYGVTNFYSLRLLDTYVSYCFTNGRTLEGEKTCVEIVQRVQQLETPTPEEKAYQINSMYWLGTSARYAGEEITAIKTFEACLDVINDCERRFEGYSYQENKIAIQMELENLAWKAGDAQRGEYWADQKIESLREYGEGVTYDHELAELTEVLEKSTLTGT